jgi:hypothetical protein
VAITLGEAVVWLRANSKEFDDALNTSEKNTKSWADRMGDMAGKAIKVGLVSAAAAVVGIGVALVDATKAAAEEEEGVVRLAATVKATKADWGVAEKAIESYLKSETKRVALDDGKGRDAINTLTLATGDYEKALKRMPLVIDFARAKKMDLNAAAELFGKIEGGNVSILSRYGIELGKDATAEEAFAAIQAKTAGQGEAYANTLQGKQEIMNIQMGNLKETIGGFLLPYATKFMGKLAELATDALPKVEVAIAKYGPVVTEVFETKLIPFLTTAWEIITNDVVPALSTAYTWLSVNIPLAVATASGVFATLKTNVLDPLVATITAIWQGFQSVVDWVTRAIDKVREWTGGESAPGAGKVPTNAAGQRPGGFANGGDFVVNRPTSILVGEAYQPERVTVTPLNRSGGGRGWGSFEFHYHDESGSHKAQATNQARAWEHRYVMGLT